MCVCNMGLAQHVFHFGGMITRVQYVVYNVCTVHEHYTSVTAISKSGFISEVTMELWLMVCDICKHICNIKSKPTLWWPDLHFLVVSGVYQILNPAGTFRLKPTCMPDAFYYLNRKQLHKYKIVLLLVYSYIPV